jgi:hypothetical protein
MLERWDRFADLRRTHVGRGLVPIPIHPEFFIVVVVVAAIDEAGRAALWKRPELFDESAQRFAHVENFSHRIVVIDFGGPFLGVEREVKPASS